MADGRAVEIRQTNVFSIWFDELRDRRAKARIDARIRRVSIGSLGDAKFFDGIGELRIDYGPGYRVYFVQQGAMIVILLAGGNKATQDRDVRAAQKLAKEIKHGSDA